MSGEELVWCCGFGFGECCSLVVRFVIAGKDRDERKERAGGRAGAGAEVDVAAAAAASSSALLAVSNPKENSGGACVAGNVAVEAR